MRRAALVSVTVLICACQVTPSDSERATEHIERAEHLLPRFGGEAEALSELDEALRLRPDCVRALELRGYFRGRVHQDAGALSDLTKAIELGSASPSTFEMRGSLRRELGDLDGAIADITSAIALTEAGPSLCWPYYLRADAWFEKGEPMRALADLDLGLRRRPNHVLSLLLRARISIQHSDYASAAAVLERALRVNPNDPLILVRRADLHIATGDYAAATADCRAALDHATPGSADAVAAQARLDEVRKRQEGSDD